ncbi:hypothetical protein BJY59DRAFT_472739 [Rhodotorula toruloides]
MRWWKPSVSRAGEAGRPLLATACALCASCEWSCAALEAHWLPCKLDERGSDELALSLTTHAHPKSSSCDDGIPEREALRARRESSQPARPAEQQKEAEGSEGEETHVERLDKVIETCHVVDVSLQLAIGDDSVIKLTVYLACPSTKISRTARSAIR